MLWSHLYSVQVPLGMMVHYLSKGWHFEECFFPLQNTSLVLQILLKTNRWKCYITSKIFFLIQGQCFTEKYIILLFLKHLDLTDLLINVSWSLSDLDAFAAAKCITVSFTIYKPRAFLSAPKNNIQTANVLKFKTDFPYKFDQWLLLYYFFGNNSSLFFLKTFHLIKIYWKFFTEIMICWLAWHFSHQSCNYLKLIEKFRFLPNITLLLLILARTMVILLPLNKPQ